MNTAVIAFACGVALWHVGGGLSTTMASAETTQVSQASRITVVSQDFALSAGNLQAEFDAFAATRPYYGAFAASADGYFGYTHGYNSLQAAIEAAVWYCSEERGRTCALYALLEPEVSQASLPVTMSANTHQGYNEYLKGVPRRAFAVADNGAYALTWDWSTRQLAEKEALAICAGYAAGEAAANANFARCRIIASD
ncbi:hypothetical protein [Sulfitobacter aestuariivivens]|nr:hypothetical protein [Sulfitobacter aestuariivivens]